MLVKIRMRIVVYTVELGRLSYGCELRESTANSIGTIIENVTVNEVASITSYKYSPSHTDVSNWSPVSYR